MKYQQTIDYPVSCERLLGIFTQPDFVLAKYAAQGASNIQSLAHSHDGDTFSVTVGGADCPLISHSHDVVYCKAPQGMGDYNEVFVSLDGRSNGPSERRA